MAEGITTPVFEELYNTAISAGSTGGKISGAGGGGYAEYASHNHPIDNDETWTDTLKPGTIVLVIPLEGSKNLEGNQLYWIADSGVKL